ncbi:MAG: hypothetical protein JWQ09_666 [Segetibacter sp.]|nr:hypothetical protein [Segetibacter sp.]
MNDEQNDIENGSETNNAAGKKSLATGGTSDSANDNAQPQDDYYSIDDPKKEITTTIGDGEMHDEGLAGVEDVTAEVQSSRERLSDEQDEAEFHDSEG